jgi:hypothetical protein
MSTATAPRLNGKAKPKVRTGPQELSLGAITDDADLQPRKTMDLDIQREYTAAWVEGANFPPVTVYFDGETYWLADGFYRVRSARKAGLDSIWAQVYDGDKRDAMFYAVGANAEHGLRRSNEDKKNAILKMLDDPEWCLWSDSEIGKACKVSSQMVARYREGSPGLKGHGVTARIDKSGDIMSIPSKAAAKPVEGVDPKTFRRPPTMMSKAEIADKFVRKIAKHLGKTDPELRLNVPYQFGVCEIVTKDHLYCFAIVAVPKDLQVAVGRMEIARACLNPEAGITIIGHFTSHLGDMIRVIREGLGIECQTPEQVLAK